MRHCCCYLQEVLDADEEPLKNKYGERMERDIVQFVPLKKYTQNNFSLVRIYCAIMWACNEGGTILR